MQRARTTIDRVGIVGAGLMGTGIAAVFACAGLRVLIHDSDVDRLNSATAEVARLASELATAGVLSTGDAVQASHRVTLTGTLADLAGEPFVLEAIPEILGLKRELYAQLEAVLADDAILASNTSGIMPSVLSAGLRRPGRFLVAHFWNPPFAIPLVEVVPALQTEAAVVEKTLCLLEAIGQEPVVLRKEIPGFIGNRLQYALLREALAIVRSGAASAAEVDSVMRASLGRRLATTGPLETADLGGLDTFLGIAEQLMPQLAKDEDVLGLMREKVAAGQTGARSGEGFYQWTPDRVSAVRGRRDRDLLRRRVEDRRAVVL